MYETAQKNHHAVLATIAVFQVENKTTADCCGGPPKNPRLSSLIAIDKKRSHTA